MLVKALRNGVGLIIVGLDKITRAKPIQRDAEGQGKAQASVEGHSLYQLFACPFCVKTRRAIHGLNVNVDIRDIKHPEHRKALAEQGGRVKVPCMRIEEDGDVRWMYESNDIIEYLNKRVAA